MRGLMRLWFAFYLVASQLGGITSVYAQRASSSNSSSISPSTSTALASPSDSSSPDAGVSISTVTLITTLISVQTVTTTGTATVQAPGAGAGSSSRSSSTSQSSRSTVYQTQTVPPLVQPTYSSSLGRCRVDGTTISLSLLALFASFSSILVL